MKLNVRLFLTVILVFTLLLSGCRSGQTKSESGLSQAFYIEEFDDYEIAEEAAYDMDFADSYAKAVPSSASNETSSQQRMIQKSASINIQVMDPVQAAEKISALTEQWGGFVVSSTSSQEYYSSEINLPRVNLSIRVPAEHLNEMLDFIEELTGDASKYVSNKRVYGVDITSDYVDTNSRLSSLEKTRDKLYEILDTAENAEEALEIYTSIADVESDIEVYKGRIKYMEESVALSSVDIKITSVRPAPIKTVQKWSLGDVFKDAFEDLLDTGKSVVELVVYILIVVIPVIILIVIPVVLIVLLVRKIIRSRKSKKDAAPKAQEKSEDILSEVKKE